METITLCSRTTGATQRNPLKNKTNKKVHPEFFIYGEKTIPLHTRTLRLEAVKVVREKKLNKNSVLYLCLTEP